MGRTASPWWWEERKGYYAFVKGSRKRLGTSLREAKDELKRLLSEPKSARVNSDHVSAILDNFLTWTQENRSPKTFRGYKDFIQSFITVYPRLTAGELTTAHVTDWLQAMKTWNSTTRRNAITALQRGLNWAAKNAGLDRNPIRGMEKPEAKRRTAVITLVEFKTLLKKIPDRDFRDLLLFCWDCGCRPQEAKRLEDRHVDLDRRRCVIPADEAKGKRTRVFYLATDRSVRIIKRRMGQGRIFSESAGTPLDDFSSAPSICTAREEIGQALHAVRLSSYMDHTKAPRGCGFACGGDTRWACRYENDPLNLQPYCRRLQVYAGASKERHYTFKWRSFGTKRGFCALKKARRRKSQGSRESARPKNELPRDQDGNNAVAR